MNINNSNGSALKGDQHEGGIDENFFVQESKESPPATELDVDQYRAGNPINLTDIKILPATQKIEIRRPKKTEWFRCRSAETVERVYLFEADGINDYYLVRRDVATELPDDCFEAYLILCVNPSGRLFLWPIKIGEMSEFTEAALTHASQARAQWCRRKWLKRLKTHRLEVNSLDGIAPEWPEDLLMRDVLARAFKDKIIRSTEHPALHFIGSKED